MTKHLIIVAGANGSGKTTLSKQVMQMRQYDFLNADEIAKEINTEVNATIQLQAGRIFFKNLNTWLSEGRNFILESTLSGKYLTKVIEKAKQNGYEITIIYAFLENPQECIERIAIRVKNGGHHIPDEDVIRRFYRSKTNFWQHYKDIVDNWSVYYNGTETPQLVFWGNQDIFTVKDEFYYRKFINI